MSFLANITGKIKNSRTEGDQHSKEVKRVAVGLSGGVDSSVAAYLLKGTGRDVTGVYLQCWDQRGDGCSADEDRADAVKVAAKLGIKFKHLNFVKEYKDRVIEYFYREYEAGRTPNPDVLCNKEIKFGLFMDWAVKNGFDYVATGHYARVKNDNGIYKLLKGVDTSKDQSYFLYLLGQEELGNVLFPLGEMTKNEVRKVARDVGLHNSDKPDSMGICFVGEVDIREFLNERIKPEPGFVVDKNGEKIGRHDGAAFYTIGQRHGFEVKKYHGLPLYVIGKNMEKNELIAGFAKDGLRKSFAVEKLHWISEKPVGSEFDCDVRIRHLGELYKANVSFLGNNGEDTLDVELTEKIFGVAPGQSAVFYSGEVVLGGGVIAR